MIKVCNKVSILLYCTYSCVSSIEEDFLAVAQDGRTRSLTQKAPLAPRLA